jgi:hypothetical protein
VREFLEKRGLWDDHLKHLESSMSKTRTYRVDLRVTLDVSDYETLGMSSQDAVMAAIANAERLEGQTAPGVHLHTIDVMDVTEVAPSQLHWDSYGEY